MRGNEMRLGRGLACVAAPMLLAQAAAGAPVTYDCDTPAGSFSELSQVQAGPAYSLRGSITALQWRDDRRWASVGQIRLENGDRSRSIALKVVRQPRGREAAIEVTVQGEGEPRTETLGAGALKQGGAFELGLNGGGEGGTETVGVVAVNQAVPFELGLNAAGEGVVVAGGQRRTFQLNLGPNAK